MLFFIFGRETKEIHTERNSQIIQKYILKDKLLQIGVWQSYQSDKNGLDIKDIVWPGQSHVPPQGVPEKFHLTVGFLEEPPFIKSSPPDPVTGKCNVDRGVPCKVQKFENPM